MKAPGNLTTSSKDRKKRKISPVLGSLRCFIMCSSSFRRSPPLLMCHVGVTKKIIDHFVDANKLVDSLLVMKQAFYEVGAGGETRTRGPVVPNHVRYHCATPTRGGLSRQSPVYPWCRKRLCVDVVGPFGLEPKTNWL